MDIYEEFNADFENILDKDFEDLLEKKGNIHLINEYKKFLNDKELFKDKQEGLYREIKWSAKRNPHLGTWCGYIHTTIDTSDIEDVVHGGFTAYNGFDCAHYDDFTPFDIHMIKFSKKNMVLLPKSKIYKDFRFVYNVIQNMINKLLDE